MESRFFARTCKIIALITLVLTFLDFKINFFGIPWHYYLFRSLAIGTLITLALKGRQKETIPLYYYDILTYVLFSVAFYGMIFIAPAYTFCFMHIFIAIGISTQTTVKRFIIQSVIGLLASAIAHYYTPSPKIIAVGANARPMMFIATVIFQAISGFIYIFVTRFRWKINELNEKYAYIGKRSSFLIHEIKTPLTRIMSQTTGTQNAVLENINAESKRILSIIESVEALIYRPEEMDKTFEKFTLKEIKDRITTDFQQYLEAINIDFKFDNADLVIFGNKSLIYQMFKNIIDNAVEAIGYQKDARPLIHIKAENVVDYTIIRIRNTHSHIPQHLLRKSFLPHFTTKNKPSNKGQGLPLSKSIVEAHHGTIWAISDESDNFTEFEIKIPVKVENV